MTRQETLQLLSRLRAAFPFAEITKDTIDLYAEYLEPEAERHVAHAVDQAIRTGRFFPSIAELSEAIRWQKAREYVPPADHADPDDPFRRPATAEEAAQIRDAIRRLNQRTEETA